MHRSSIDRYRGKAAIYMVSAWVEENRLVLGQRNVADESNEISAISELLDLLEVAGCIVTIDAIGCQTQITETIVRKQAYYVLTDRENWPHLYEDLAYYIQMYLQEENPWQWIQDHHQTLWKAHGRIETRQCITRAQKDFAPKNLTVIRYIALNMLRHESTAKDGIQAKRLQAA